MRPVRVLFLGIRNATRSQLGEAFVRSLAGDRVEVASAGVAPAPVHELTRLMLAESGLNPAPLLSKSANTFLGKATFNVVIIACEPSEALCPTMFFGALRREVWPIADPSDAPVDHRVDAFRRMRDQMLARARTFVAEDPALRAPTPAVQRLSKRLEHTSIGRPLSFHESEPRT